MASSDKRLSMSENGLRRRPAASVLTVAIGLALQSVAPCSAAEEQAEQNASAPPIEEVVVRGVRAAEINAREMERDKNNFSSIITTDDAGNFADQNAAETLQRLPGITLQRQEGEGRFINLRGLGPSFTSVNMDGSELANGSGGDGTDEGRGFSLDSVTADLLQAIVVNKTLTPDMDLNSIGGSVDLRTVSALDRGRNTLKVKAQGIYQDLGEQTSPKLTVQGTRLFAEETFGISAAFSWEERETQGYETFTHDSSLPRLVTVGDESMIIPFELQNRQENARRERFGGNLDFDWRPSESARYYARYSRTEFTDEDLAFREYYRFAQAAANEIVYLDPARNIFGLGGGDLQQHVFIQDGTVGTEAYSLGGSNEFGGGWKMEYDLARSTADFDKPDARRVQFRITDLTMLGSSGPEFINGQVVAPQQLAELAGMSAVPGGSGLGPSGYRLGEQSQPNALYDNIFIEDSFRHDVIEQASVNLTKDFDGGFIDYLKTGAKVKLRTRDRIKTRKSVVPGDKAVQGCAGNLQCVAAAGSVLGDFDTRRLDSPAFDHSLITASEAQRLLALTRPIADNFDTGNNEVESTRHNYEIEEDATAAYLMGNFLLNERSGVIVGLRYERTDFNSTGFLSLRNDREESADQLESFDIALPLPDTENSYDGLFPSVHYRNELSDTLLLRASAWTSFARPDFDQARARFEVTDRVIFCNNDPAANLGANNCSDNPANLQGALPGSVYTDEYKRTHLEFAPQNSVTVGNPKLRPADAKSLDLSLGWYASRNLFLQGALFYKNIDDFIVEANGVNIALDRLPFGVPVDQVGRFVIPADVNLTNVRTFLNGDSAEVYGAELTYVQYFTTGWLNHFFIQSNLTWLDSKADVGDTVRVGKVSLPEQADLTANATLGWENDVFSVRLVGNYHSKLLKRIGACTASDIAADAALGLPQECQKWADIYQGSQTRLDARASLKLWSKATLFFDATNLTDKVDYFYYQGNALAGGRQLFRSADYGSTYELGLTVDF